MPLYLLIIYMMVPFNDYSFIYQLLFLGALINVVLIIVLFIYTFVRNDRFEEKINKSRLYPGLYSNIHKFLVMFILLITIILASIIQNYLKVHQVSFIYQMLVMLAVLIILIILLILVDPIVKISMRTNRTAEVYKGLEAYNKYLYKRQHYDNESYIKLLKSEIAFLVDVDKSEAIFNDIVRPDHKKFRKVYDQIKVMRKIRDRDLDGFEKEFNKFTKTYPKDKKMTERINYYYKLYFTEDVLVDIEKKNPINSIFKLQNNNNADTLIYYYMSRHQEDKALPFIKYVLDNGKMLTTVYQSAKKAMNDILDNIDNIKKQMEV